MRLEFLPIFRFSSDIILTKEGSNEKNLKGYSNIYCPIILIINNFLCYSSFYKKEHGTRRSVIGN